MKSARKVVFAMSVIASGILFVSPASAGAVAPTAGAGKAVTQLVNSDLLIEVRKRPGKHRPNFKRKHRRKKWRTRRWGRRIGRIIVGTAIAVAIAGQVPPRPAPGLCWVWTNSARTQGYWYDC